MHLNNSFLGNALLLNRKKISVDIQNLPGIWYINWQIRNITLFSTFYTRIDQACICWGVISAVIFATAQFLPISWSIQAVLWSALTLSGIVFMVRRTWVWVRLEGLRWLIYSWIFLMLVGLVITDLSIFFSWGQVLINLCNLWLGLSALGYFITGIGMGAPTFIITGVMHLLSMLMLPYVGNWQFLTTGIVMGLSILILAEFEWKASETCAKGLDYHQIEAETRQKK